MVQFCRAAEPGSGRASDSVSQSCPECASVNAALETVFGEGNSICLQETEQIVWVDKSDLIRSHILLCRGRCCVSKLPTCSREEHLLTCLATLEFVLSVV